MADVNAAIEYVLKQEDSTLSGVITDIAEKVVTHGNSSLITSDHFTVSER